MSSQSISRKREKKRYAFFIFAVTSESDNSSQDLLSFENNFYDDIWSHGTHLRKIYVNLNLLGSNYIFLSNLLKIKSIIKVKLYGVND